MIIKNLKVNNNSMIKARLCALSLAGGIAATMAGCSNSNNNNPERQEQNLISIENTEEKNTFLDEKSPEIYRVYSLTNGEKRGILLSDESHLYESMFEETDTKVYLSDENGNRLSNNFDYISLLSNYLSLSRGGVLLGNWTKVYTDKQYDFFVGKTLRQDSKGRTLEPNITLLDNNGLELYSFNGYFKALIGKTLVIETYFEGEDRKVGAPDTYLYDYITGKKSEKHDYVKVFNYTNEKNEETAFLIGVNLSSNHLYSLYDEDLEIVGIATKKEIEEWYINNVDIDSYKKASGDYVAYFKSIYDNVKKIEQSSSSRLTK